MITAFCFTLSSTKSLELEEMTHARVRDSALLGALTNNKGKQTSREE